MKIIADKNIPYLKGVVEQYGDVTYLEGSEFNKETIKEAETLIVRTVTHFDQQILEGSDVRLICSATIGFDHIDTEYCDAHGIKWTNAPGCNSGSVQQYIVSCLMVLSEKKNINLRGKVIGIVGVGNVGRKVAAACQLLGMRVLLNDPLRQLEEPNNPDFVDLAEIQRESDFITFHTPLIKTGEYATYHLANQKFFSKLSKEPFVINSARGGIIDTAAIKEALKNKTIRGAIIDCWEKEPTIDLEYMNMADIATPHIAGYSADGKANASIMSLHSIANFWNLSTDPISEIQVPEISNPFIDYNTIKRQNKLAEIFLQTYNPLSDMKRLVEAPDKFKQHRANYPLRREYKAYNVENVPDSTPDEEVLKKLGFFI